MRANLRNCAGFSLMELLMVVFIISVVLGLLLPGVNSARDAARRTQCTNNLRQIILALHNYETQHAVLPPGVVDWASPIHNRAEGLHTSWTVQLLPYMEQSYMYQVWDTDASVYATENSTVRRTTLSSFVCPVDPLAQRGTFGSSSYAACHHDVEAPISTDNHGMFFLNSHVRSEDATDGASNTIYVGEKTLDPAPNDLGWMSGTRSTLRNTGTLPNATPPAPAANGDPSLTVGGFGSHHQPGGANFAFGDGSVRWVSNNVEPRLYRYLGHRADGEMLDDTAY